MVDPCILVRFVAVIVVTALMQGAATPCSSYADSHTGSTCCHRYHSAKIAATATTKQAMDVALTVTTMLLTMAPTILTVVAETATMHDYSHMHGNIEWSKPLSVLAWLFHVVSGENIQH